MRRTSSTRRSIATSCCSRPLRSSSGITRSLLTMVDSATLATITMPVAADNPPM